MIFAVSRATATMRRVIALGLPLLAACAAPHKPAPIVSRGPAAVFSAVRAREDRIASLRARFTAESRRAQERHTTDGVLLVQKPNRFRLRMMLPFGLTVFDYVQSDDRVQLSLPLQGRVVSGTPPSDLMPFSQADLAEAFLRGPAAFPGTCAAEGNAPAQIVVLCRDRSGALLRRIRIDRATATIDEETTYQEGLPSLVLRYGDYRHVDDTELPFRIEMLYPERDLSLAIKIDRYEVNPALPDRLFQPAGPSR